MDISNVSENLDVSNNINNFISFFDALGNMSLLSAILISLAIIFVFFALSRIISYIFKKYISKLTTLTHSTLDDLIIGILDKHLPLFVLFAGLYFSTFYFTSYFLQEYSSFALLVVFIAFVFLILRAFVDLVTLFLSRLCESPTNITKKDRGVFCDRTLVVYGTSISKVFMYFVFFLIVLFVFGVDISIFVASLGIWSIVIGLAAQATFSDFISGTILLLSRPFVVGDFIKIADLEGQVLKIGLMSTKIVTKNNEEIIIPNSNITKANIVNYRKIRSHTGGRFEINISVAYGVNVDVVKNILLSIADKTDGVFKNPKPIVRLIGVSGHYLNFSLLFWCLYQDRHSLQNELYTKLLSEFKKHKIKI